MTEEQRKVAIPVTVDGTAAKQGFEQIKADARDMAQAVGQAGQGAGAAMDAGIVAAVRKATAATQEASQQVMTWAGFLKQNMGPAMKEALDAGASHAEAHTTAIRKISAQWAVYKETVKSAGAAAANASAAVAQSTAAAGASSDKLSASQARLMSELQRSAVVATQGRSAWLEHRAAILGVSDAASPYIAKLRQAEQGQASLHNSVKQTTFALRQVPMQMTDIVTSLASGQRPLQVLLQQGGQLKDLFGGIGPAAKAMGGYLLSLINPFTVTAAAVGGLAYAFLQGEKEAREFQNALILSGNAVGMSANQYSELRDSLAGIAGTKGKAAAALTEIAKSGMFAGEQVRGIAEAAILMEKATGQPVDKTVAQFKRLAEEPAKASAELNKQTNYLTASLYAQIKALEESGKTTDAAAIAMKAYGEAQASVAKKVVENAGWLEKAWKSVGAAAQWSWNQMLGVGRDLTGSEQLAKLRERAQMLRSKGVRVPESGPTSYAEADLDRTQKHIALLERLNAQVDANAKAEGARAQANRVLRDVIDSVTKANERAAPKQEQETKAITAYRSQIKLLREEYERTPTDALKKLIDPAKIAAAEKAIRDQFKDRGAAAAKPLIDQAAVAAAKQYGDAMSDLLKIHQAAGPKADDLSKAQARLRQEMESPAWATYSRQQQEQIIYSAALAQGAENEAKAHDALKKSVEDSAKAYATFAKEQADAERKGVTDVLKRVSDLRQEAETYGLLESQVALVTLARLKDNLAAASAAGENVDYIREQIAAQEKLVTALQGKELREANKTAADAASKEWERVADSFVDNLMRGGKSVAQYLKDLFRTLVLKPILAPIGQAMAGVVGTAFGVPAMAQSAAGSAGASMAGSFAGTYLGKAGTSLLGSGTALGNMFAGATGVGGSFASTVGAGLATDAMGATVASGTAAATLGTASTIGSTLMAAAPYLAIAAIVISSLLKKGGGPKVDGQFNPFTNDAMGVGNSADQSQSEAARVAAQAIQAQYDSLATQLGGRLGLQFGVGISADPKGTAPSMVQVAGGAGGVRQFESVNKDVGRSEQDLQAAIAKQSVEVLFTALRSSQLDKPFAEFFNSVAESASVEIKTAALKTAGDVATYSAQITDLGGVFERLADLSVAARGALIEAAGGLQALAQSTSTYYENFYSEEERRAITIGRIGTAFASVGLSLDGIDLSATTARKAFRDIVDSLDLTTDAGQKQYTTLMTVAGAFASVTPSLDAIGDAAADAVAPLETLAEAMQRLRNPQRSVEDIARGIIGLEDERGGLQVDLLRAQGDEPAARALQRSLDIAGFSEAEVAIYDYNQGIRDQIDVLNTAQAAQEEIANQKYGMETRILQLEGNTAAVRERELLAMDDSLRPLQWRIWALQDEAEATGTAAAASKAIADQRYGLEGRLLQLQGNTTEMRRRELAALDPTNRALQRHIWAIEDAKTAYQGYVAETDKAFSALERSLGVQRTLAQETIDQVRSVFEAVREAARGLYADVDSTRAMQGRQAREFIASALGAARLTGYLPDGGALQAAIAAVRSEMGQKVYTSKFEADRDRLILAGQLSELEKVSGKQLTEAERQLEALDGILENARAQVDALRGIDNSVLSVAEALRRVEQAILFEKVGAAVLETVTNPPPPPPRPETIGTTPHDIAVKRVNDEIAKVTSYGQQYGGDAYYFIPGVNDLGAKVETYTQLAGMIGTSLEEAIKLGTGKGLAYWEEVQRQFDAGLHPTTTSIRGFAEGTNFVPSDMLALIHQGEAIVQRAYNPAGGGDPQRMERLIEGLTAEVQRLQGLVADGNHEQWRTANAVNGNPEAPILVDLAGNSGGVTT